MSSETLHRHLSALLVLVVIPVAATVWSAVIAGWLCPSDMGWDQLGWALGGGFLGFVAGLFAASMMVWKWTPGKRYPWVGGAALATAALLLLIYMTADNPGDQPFQKTSQLPSHRGSTFLDAGSHPVRVGLSAPPR